MVTTVVSVNKIIWSFGPWFFFLTDAMHLIFLALSAFSQWFCFPLFSDQWIAKQEVSW